MAKNNLKKIVKREVFLRDYPNFNEKYSVAKDPKIIDS